MELFKLLKNINPPLIFQVIIIIRTIETSKILSYAYRSKLQKKIQKKNDHIHKNNQINILYFTLDSNSTNVFRPKRITLSIET